VILLLLEIIAISDYEKIEKTIFLNV